MKNQYGLMKTQPEQIGMSVDRLARITDRMQEYIDKSQVPGLLTAVARRGKVVHFETLGYADVENQIPLSADNIFRLYSMTKPVTAVAVMILYEEGRYFLDDPVADYLPEFSNMKVWTDNGLVDTKQPLTIHHLLTHTGGISFFPFSEKPVSVMYREAGVIYSKARETLSTEEYVKKIAQLPLASHPGEVWSYGESMDVLGRLVEVVSGQPYGEFLRRRIFEPLQMADTAFYVPEEKIGRLACLYEAGPDGKLISTDTLPLPDFVHRTVQANDYMQPPSFESGGAGLVGTAADYLRFSQMLLNKGELDGVRVLSPTTVKLILSNHLGPEFGERPLVNMVGNTTQSKGLGFGFCGAVVTNALAVGRAGSDGQYSWGGAASTDFWIDPEQNLIGLVLTQRLPTSGVHLTTLNRMHQMTYQAIVD